MRKCIKYFISPACFLICLLLVILLIIIMDNFFIPSNSTVLLPHRGVYLLNISNFNYIIHNDVCDTSATGELKAILIITSHAGNFHVRQTHRQALPKSLLLNIGVRRVFLLAVSQNLNDKQYRNVEQNEIVKESNLNADLIQGNFREAYRNLTYKHVMGLQWVTTFCKNARYIIKMDDDIIVDIYRLVNLLPQIANVSSSFMLGYVLNGVKPSRNPISKWFVNYAEYPRSTYPPFLSGWMYITTPSVATEIVNYTHLSKYKYPRKNKDFQSFFWIDDVFVTGIIAQQLKIQLFDLSRYFAVHPQYFLCCIETALIERLRLKDGKYYFPCDYIVGPSGGNLHLLLQVLKEAENCWRADENCQRHSNISVNKKCTVGRAEAYDWIRRPPQEGKAMLKEIRL